MQSRQKTSKLGVPVNTISVFISFCKLNHHHHHHIIHKLKLFLAVSEHLKVATQVSKVVEI